MIRLAFIVVFGTDWKERRLRKERERSYPCPSCQTERQFQVWEAHKVFSLYWVALFTVERGPQFWRCTQCQRRYAVPDLSD